jgi:tRNA-modifying protein YgfZ
LDYEQAPVQSTRNPTTVYNQTMLQEHYDAARKSAAIFPQAWLGVLRLTGTERQSWLQGMVTNDVEKLKPGDSCYAAHLNAQGKVVAQMNVRAAADALWLIVERLAIEKLASAFDKLIIMEDAQIQNVSSEYAVLGLVGPHADRVIQSLDCVAARTELGYDLIVPRDAETAVMNTLVGAGALAVDPEVWNVLRAEHGLPLYGVDADETTTMPELGQRGINYDKGCYIGQEVVARIRYIGHVNRRFVGFVCEGNEVPEVRSVVEVQGKDSGYITTAVNSPGLGKAIALGFVNRVAGEPGTAVVLAGKNARIPARVAGLPIIS